MTKVVDPFVAYVEARLAEESDVLYVLDRYRRQVAWFDRDDLWARYQADTKHGEAIYDRHLRALLFD